MISYNPQPNPYSHVDDWATWQEEVCEDNTDNTNTGLTTAKHYEVFVLNRDKREGELHLQKQVQAWVEILRYNPTDNSAQDTFQKHPVEASEMKEESKDPTGTIDLVKHRKEVLGKF